RGQQHAVAGDDLRLQRGDRLGNAVLRFDVAVVERDAVQGGDVEFDPVARGPLCGAQQGGVERTGAQAAGDAEDACHALAPASATSAVAMRTSPVSTLWIGQALATCSRRSRWAASSSPSSSTLRLMSVTAAGLPSGLNASSTFTPASGHCLRPAYIISVTAVQLPSADSSRCSG